MDENQKRRRDAVRVFAIAIVAVAVIALGTATLIVYQLRKAVEESMTDLGD